MGSEYFSETAENNPEQFLNHIEACKEYSFSVYQKIRAKFDACLSAGIFEPLLDLLPYFHSPDSHPDFILTSEMQKVHILLNALQLEIKSDKSPFMSAAETFEDLLSQYLLTVFALRRLELSLSQDAMDEASTYLHSIPFDIYIAKLLIENEYFENYLQLYQNTYFCMCDTWSVYDKIPWLTWLLEKGSSETITMELASLYMEIQNFDKAYTCLSSIPTPSREILSLKKSIEELLKL